MKPRIHLLGAGHPLTLIKHNNDCPHRENALGAILRRNDQKTGLSCLNPAKCP